MFSYPERHSCNGASPIDPQGHEARRAVLSSELDHAGAQHDASLTEGVEAGEMRDDVQLLRAADDRTRTDTHIAVNPVTAFVHMLPVELIQAIWALVEPDRIPMSADMHKARKAAERAFLLPSRLAGVCRAWRAVALDTPELWSIIAFPIPVRGWKGLQGFLEQVDLHLARSGMHGLDLLLYDDADPTFPQFERLLSLATRHVHRWRRVRLILPRNLGTRILDNLLIGCAMTMLEKLHVDAFDDEVLAAPWLCQASSLTTIYTRSLRFHPPPLLRLSSVLSVDFDVHMTVPNQLWSVLRAFPQLKALCLRLYAYRETNPIVLPENDICLSNLESLTLRGYFHVFERLLVAGLTAPQLNRLNIEASEVGYGGAWGREFFTMFSSIIHLELVGDGSFMILASYCCGWSIESASQVAALRTLRQLKSVSLIGCRFPRGKVGASFRDLFLRLDTDGNAVSHPGRTCCSVVRPPPRLVWPELESLNVQGVSKEEATEELLAEMACFVRTRAAACAERGKRFEFSLLEWPAAFPSWFCEALGSILGPEHVLLTTSDGLAHDAVCDDEDGGEESEAEFTDTDSVFTDTRSSCSDGEFSSSVGSDEDTDDDWMPESGTKTWGYDDWTHTDE